MAAAAAMPNSLSTRHQPPAYIDPYFSQTAPPMIPGAVYPPVGMTWQSNLYYPAIGVPSTDSFNYGGQFGTALPPTGYFPPGAGVSHLPMYNPAFGGLPYSFATPQQHSFPTAIYPQTVDAQNHSSDLQQEYVQELEMNRAAPLPRVSIASFFAIFSLFTAENILF